MMDLASSLEENPPAPIITPIFSSFIYIPSQEYQKQAPLHVLKEIYF
jgi:hypothetical protein